MGRSNGHFIHADPEKGIGVLFLLLLDYVHLVMLVYFQLYVSDLC